MFTNLFERIKSFVIHPAEAWRFALKEPYDDFLSKYFYPVVGVYALATFVGHWWELEQFSVDSMLRYSLARLTAILLIFFLGSLLLQELLRRFENVEHELRFIRIFVGYSLMAKLLVGTLLELHLFSIVAILKLGALWFIGHGVIHYLKLPREQQLRGAGWALLAILGVSTIIDQLVETFIL